MPIDDDARVAITLRLQTAYAETLESYTRKPAWIELLRDVALAQQWLTIGAAYSGIEQTLKYLIALQMDFTVDELLVERGILENPREEPERRTRYRIHQLAILFRRLDHHTREAVEHDYAVWQSLYDYLTIPRCVEFLEHIQRERDRLRSEPPAPPQRGPAALKDRWQDADCETVMGPWLGFLRNDILPAGRSGPTSILASRDKILPSKPRLSPISLKGQRGKIQNLNKSRAYQRHVSAMPDLHPP